MNESLAPVCLFAYKRLANLKHCISALQQNELAAQTELYIFSDAAAKTEDFLQVKAVRDFLLTIHGFRTIEIIFAETNKGLGDSIINGVTNVINNHEKVIVLEDDLIVSPNFLNYMNEALETYNKNQQIFSVSGYTVPVNTPNKEDVYFTKRASSWGWATWKNRWQDVDWKVSDYAAFSSDRLRQKRFNKMGSDMTSMLAKQMHGKINSWAIRWTYHQFKKNLYTVFPVVSKVINDGFGNNATHTSKAHHNRFFTNLDAGLKKHFHFPEQPFLHPEMIKQFTSFYSMRTRAIYKLKNLFSSFLY